MKLLLMGPQGCGKGTIGEKLSEKLGIPLISVGQVLRDIPADHYLYEEMHSAMVKGVLAPNDKVAELLKERVLEEDCKNGYILDGWARQMSDLDEFDPGFGGVLNIKISRETSVKRISGRRTCSSDGKIYNIYTLPKEMLAECKGELVQRADDTEEAVKTRLEIYYSETQEVLDYFATKGILREIDGEGTPQEVFDLALEALKIK